MNINPMDMGWLLRLEAADAEEHWDNHNTAQWRKFQQPITGSTTAQNCRGSVKILIVHKNVSENQTTEYVHVFSVLSFLESTAGLGVS
jgi:hypothetical protein